LEEKLYHEKEEQKNKAAQSALRIISISLAEQRHKRALEVAYSLTCFFEVVLFNKRSKNCY